jgi:YHS domain-containing protein
LGVVAAILGLGAWTLWAADAPAEGTQPSGQAKPEQALCPVKGEPVDFSVRLDTEDGPVYFCCPNCIPKYKADPKTYAAKVAAQRAVLAKLPRVQVTCPVSGKPIDGKTYLEIGGVKIGFCCPDCPPKYKQDPAKYKAKLEGSYTYQTKCPVSDEDITPTVFTDLSTGQRIYFCCSDCIAQLKADPAKYAPKLAAQGVKIDPKKIKAEDGDKPADEHAGHNMH